VTEVPAHLRILYKAPQRYHAAVCAALCEGCRCEVPSVLERGKWEHLFNGERLLCFADAYRKAVAPERSADFAVFEAAVEAGYKGSGQ
jgi:hypothetical protein